MSRPWVGAPEGRPTRTVPVYPVSTLLRSPGWVFNSRLTSLRHCRSRLTTVEDLGDSRECRDPEPCTVRYQVHGPGPEKVDGPTVIRTGHSVPNHTSPVTCHKYLCTLSRHSAPGFLLRGRQGKDGFFTLRSSDPDWSGVSEGRRVTTENGTTGRTETATYGGFYISCNPRSSGGRSPGVYSEGGPGRTRRLS